MYFFDCDKTIYQYDFRKRLPALSRISGVSQYGLASSWWAGGYETRAEAGEWPTPEEYLDAFADVTGARLSLDQWAVARKAAMTPIAGSLAAMATATELGVASLLSNNPSPFQASFAELAPEAADILGENVLVSAGLGARKPSADLYERALAHYDVAAESAFFADDSLANVEGARAVGITAYHFTGDTDGLMAAVLEFSRR